MDPTKWRISKACEECRLRKIRCDGRSPCQRCQTRSILCEYRKKARNRMRREAAGSSLFPPPLAQSARHGDDDDQKPAPVTTSGSDSSPTATYGGSSSNGASATAATLETAERAAQNRIHNHSVAATHRASPSVFLQLYYGPSSTFSLLNSIYHQVEGTRPTPGAAKEVEEIGPGLDLFNIRRLYFGDLAGMAEPDNASDCTAGMFLDRPTAASFMEKYLSTYWNVLPIWSKDEFRMRLDLLYGSMLNYCTTESPETIIVLLVLALGASILEKEDAAQFLFRKAKRWSASLDDMVNIQTVQIALLMINARPNSGFLMAGVAVRKAVAAGLHKDVTGATHSKDDTRQGRITIWCVYFWEIWLCFSLGRPSSFPESDIDVPFPSEEKVLQALVTLSRLMSKCVNRIYRHHHDSLLPMWNAANDIRRELRQFAKEQLQDLKFGLDGDAYAGELGVCQTIVSTVYHHTLLLTFRPFLVLRAKLHQDAAADGRPGVLPALPAWLDTACEYCLDAARHTISYLAGAFEKNELCRVIKYHGFFLEGASQVLAFYLLQDRKAGRANFPWIQQAIQALQLLGPMSRNSSRLVDLSGNLERMVQSVYPDFRARDVASTSISPTVGLTENNIQQSSTNVSQTAVNNPMFPFTPFGLGESGASSVESPNISSDVVDLTTADLGCDFDFSTMNMEAFLTIDPNMPTDFTTYR